MNTQKTTYLKSKINVYVFINKSICRFKYIDLSTLNIKINKHRRYVFYLQFTINVFLEIL